MVKDSDGVKPIRTMLLVEDEPMVARAFLRYAQRSGVVAEHALTLEGAVKLLEEKTFDVILWDSELGSTRVSDVAEAVARYADRAPYRVATSGKTENRKRFRSAGCTHSVEKTVVGGWLTKFFADPSSAESETFEEDS